MEDETLRSNLVAHKLNEGQTDVVIDGTPADNELLAYDSASGKWINQTANEAGINLGKIFLSSQGGWPRTTNGCASAALSESTTNKINYYTLDFDKDTDEYAQWVLAMPSDWDGGTVTAVAYWTFATGNASETVSFVVKGGSYGDSDAIDTALGTGQNCNDTAITAGDVHISAASSAITIANAAASELIVFECMRDVSEDNLAGDAKLLGLMITFTRS